MFNLKNHKSAQITSEEKYLRSENVGPEADDKQPIWEKELPHRDGYEQTITEDQMSPEQSVSDKDAQVIEKVLNEAESYVPHRSDASNLPVPPINALVEKIRQDRIADTWKESKDGHWSQSLGDKKQNGSLPKWPKNAPQHDKIVLNNDPERFKGLGDLTNPVNPTKGEIKPLVGGITTADIDRVVTQVKEGMSIDFDTAMIAILREAEREKRELSKVEQRAIGDLKIARTKELLRK